jgi:tetratricopeptide (TPR) repeat protein
MHIPGGNMKANCFEKICCAAALWLCGAGFIPAQANFTRGEALFMENKPAEAVRYLENAVAEDGAHVLAYLYLGIVYEQLDRPGEAVAVYRKILDRAGDLTAHVAANLGNVYFKMGDTAGAEQCYTRALEADPGYASASLGRANTRLKAGSLRPALADYELYLSLEPRSPRRSQIERLIAFVHSEFAADERRKLLAEEAARAEAERQRRLLEDVAASLQSAAGDSQGLSTGAENVEGYEGEFELE